MKKTVIITGAAGNLGKAVVSTFLEAGYRVVATLEPGGKHDFSNDPSLEMEEVNITSEQESTQLVQRVTADRDTTLEAVVMLVGGFALGSIRQTSGAELQKMYTLNFESAYYVAKAAFVHMETQPQGGRLFFVGAKPAIEPQAGKDMIAYALSKSLLFKLAELLNAEGRKSNIISTVVVPSTIDTARNRKEMPDAKFSDWVRAEDIAQTIAFFCEGPGRSLRDEVVKVYNNA